MATYLYRAASHDGKIVRGTASAPDEADLYRQLLARSLELIDCRRERPGRVVRLPRQAVGTRELIQLCLHLAEMSEAGVPLLDALEDVRDSTANGRLSAILGEICRAVAEGAPLSAAFARHGDVFSTLFVGLVAAGETTGGMAESFRQLVRHLTWSETMTQRVRKAVRYPILLAIVVAGLIVFMMSFVVPQVIGFLGNVGIEAPLATRALVRVSAIFAGYWWAAPVAAAALWALIRAGRLASSDFAVAVDRAILRLPVIGGVLRKIALARFAHMFAVMFNAGIGMLESLAESRKLIANLALRGAVERLHARVEAGSPLSAAMAVTGEFPTLVVRMVRIGEQTGGLGQTLDRVREFYDRDVEDAIQRATQMIEPALTAVLGITMGWIALAIFGPVYDSLGSIGR